jgi:hypothetical protein
VSTGSVLIICVINGLVATQLLSSKAITFGCWASRWMQAILQISLVAPLFFDLKPVVIMSHLTRQTCLKSQVTF